MIDIDANKNTFITLLKKHLIDTDETAINAFIQYLENSDFFYAPASTKYHLCEPGGLCEYSLNVYYNLKNLVNIYGMKNCSEETLVKIGLLHSLYKVNMYEQYYKNVKVDNNWVQELSYKVSENKELFGNGGFTSYMLISRYLPLSEPEIVALVNFDRVRDSNFLDMNSLLAKNKLLVLLHCAVITSTYITSLVTYNE